MRFLLIYALEVDKKFIKKKWPLLFVRIEPIGAKAN